LVFQQLLTAHAIEPVDKARSKRHQNLIICETTPADAYYLQSIIRAALIEARLMHAGLSNKAKSDLVDLFNDSESLVTLLIMTTGGGAVGFNSRPIPTTGLFQHLVVILMNELEPEIDACHDGKSGATAPDWVGGEVEIEASADCTSYIRKGKRRRQRWSHETSRRLPTNPINCRAKHPRRRHCPRNAYGPLGDSRSSELEPLYV